jgi:hypothetical protein
VTKQVGVATVLELQAMPKFDDPAVLLVMAASVLLVMAASVLLVMVA